jgi:CheY-like chemotaxis protein
VRTPRCREGAQATADKALILIVDDDFDFVEINRMVLERAGYRVASASEPQAALRKIHEEKPDLIISDLMMTAMDSGFSFTRALKEKPEYAGIPVIMSTSVSSAMGLDFRPRTAEEAKQMNVDAYFDKPLVPAKLLPKIAELLAGRSDKAAASADGAEDPAPGATGPAGASEGAE